MSAHLVEPNHITEIVKWGVNPQQGDLKWCYNPITQERIDCDAVSLVKLLAQANIDSLIARYNDKPSDYKDFVKDCLAILKYSTDGTAQSLMSGVGSCELGPDSISNMIRCLNYQSCEVKDWYLTDAYWVLNAITDNASRMMSSNAKVQWSMQFDAVDIA